MREFLDYADAGRQLADALGPISDKFRVVAISPSGLEVALCVSSTAQLLNDRYEDFAGEQVLVIDSGVETGTRAWEVVQGLRLMKVSHVDLAVPVCSRQVKVKLESAYDNVTALVTPLAPRSLRWHYQHLAN